jgi:hypothetical protein
MNNSKNIFGLCVANIEKIFVIILGLMLLLTVFTIIWGVDRTLGIGDEGVYLLAARYPDEIMQNVSSVYIYTGFLFEVSNFDPVVFRLSGVVLICGSALLFWFGFYNFIIYNYQNALTINYLRSLSLIFIVLGALLYYQWFYMTPNYNTLISVAINIFAGSVLYGVAKSRNWKDKKNEILFAFFFSGLSIGFALFVKIPAGISLLALFIIFISCLDVIDRYKKILLSVSFLFGLVFWFSGHFIFVVRPGVWWQMLKEGWELYQTLGIYSPRGKIFVYFEDLVSYIYSAVKLFYPCYIFIFLYFIFGARLRLSDKFRTIYICFVILLAASLSAKAGVSIGERKLIDGSLPVYLVFHLSWIILLLSFFIFEKRSKVLIRGNTYSSTVKTNRSVMVVFVFLVALPIAGSAGTQNPIYNVPLCHAATWFGAILLLILLFNINAGADFLIKFLSMLIIGAFTVSQIIQGYIYDPQTAVTNLLHQVEATEVGNPLGILRLDKNQHNLVNKLSILAKSNGFKLGDDIIAFDFIPGLVYAMGGRSPGHPVFIIGNEGRLAYSEFALKFADIERLKKSYVLLDVGENQLSDVKETLNRRGIDFPVKYRLLGEVASGDKIYSLWKPF